MSPRFKSLVVPQVLSRYSSEFKDHPELSFLLDNLVQQQQQSPSTAALPHAGQGGAGGPTKAKRKRSYGVAPGGVGALGAQVAAQARGRTHTRGASTE
jgi:hypothetical protein